MKKICKIISLIILPLVLVSCDGGQDEKIDYDKTFSVTWKNDNGDILEQDLDVPYNSMPSYDGTTPVKDSTAEFSYSFSGWSPEIKKVTSDITYTACFNGSKNKYEISWLNYDNTLICKDSVEYGVVPEFKQETPTKPSTAELSYTFSGWSPEVVGVTGNASYKAQFNSSLRKYNVTWKNYDGTTLLTIPVEYGSIPSYNGDLPTKPSTAELSYTFTGWSPAISNVYSDQTYVAQFSSEVRTYSVTWKNYDGATLLTENYVYGSVPSFKGNTPTRASTVSTNFAFNGWSPEISSVKNDTVYFATYSESVRKYKIKFLNFDNSLLQEIECDYGSVPVYEGEDPVKPSSNTEIYNFSNWSPSISACTGDAIYTACFEGETRLYKVEYKNASDVTIYTDYVEYGQPSTYGLAELPTCEPDLEFSYVFKEWDKDTSCIYADTICRPIFKDISNFIYELTVNGNGVSEYRISVNPEIANDIKNIVIPTTHFSGVKTYPVTSFYSPNQYDYKNGQDFRALKSLYIPTSILEIGPLFKYSSNGKLDKLTLPLIKEHTISKLFGSNILSKFKDIEILETSEKTLDSTYFKGQESILASVTFPTNLTSLPKELLKDFVKLEGTNISNLKSLKTVGVNAFYGCAALKECIFPDSITSFGGWNLKGCLALTRISLPCLTSSKLYFDQYSNPKDLQYIRVYSGEIASECFKGIETIKTFVVGPKVTKINSSAFENCINLTTVEIEKGDLDSICYHAFYRCISLSEINLENAVKLTSIDITAFEGCYELDSLYFGPSVSSISINFYDEYDYLSNFTISAENENFKVVDGILYSYDMKSLIRCPGKIDKKDIYIPDSVERIENQAFQNCKWIENVVFGTESKCIYIGDKAFASCLALKNINIPTNVTYLGEKAFSYCIDLVSTNISHNSKISALKNRVFQCCFNLKNLNVPDSVIAIESYAFANSEFTDVKFSLNSCLEYIETDSFKWCSTISGLVLPDSIKTLYASSLSGIKDWIVLPAVETLETGALNGTFVIYALFNSKPSSWSDSWNCNREFLWKNEWNYNEQGIPKPIVS